MLCSYKNIKQRSSWGNDQSILVTGFFLIALYILLTTLIASNVTDSLIHQTFKHVKAAFDINEKTEANFIIYLSLLWHIFWLSAISGFIGIPIARVFEGCLGKQTEIQYTRLREKILFKDSSYSCKWNNILLILQENRHNSALAQLKKYIINGERLDIPAYSGVLSSIRHIKRISNVLLTIENIMQKEGKSSCEKKVSYYRSRIRLLHFKTDLYKNITTLVYFIIPAILAIIISKYLQTTELLFLPKGIFSFFWGAALILSSMQFATLSYSAMGLFAYIWRKQCKRYDDMIFKAYALIISLAVFITIFMMGVYVLDPPNEEVLKNMRILFTTTSNIVIPLVNESSEYNLINQLPKSIQFVLQVSTAIVVSICLKLIFEYVLGKYEQSTSGEHEKHFSIPAELVSIFGAFFIFILATGLIYSSLVSLSETPVRSSTHRSSNAISDNDNGIVHKIEGGGHSENASTNVESSKSLGSFLPYSIFLALVGAMLAISTRELLENYFAGISMKVDMPFEQGDRLEIDNIGMCEVREVGLRSVNLYSISNNAIVSIPNKEISKGIISNYTQPTLDYRRSVSLSVAAEFISGWGDKRKNKSTIQDKIDHDFRYIKDCKLIHYEDGEGVVETSRSLLLIAAFLSTGVKTPSARRFFCYNWVLENMGDTIERPDRGMKYSAVRDIDNFSKRELLSIDSSRNLISILESVVRERDYREVDNNELDHIWDRLKLIQKINDKPLNDLFLMDVPLLLDDASMIKRNVKYMDTNYIKRSKVRVAKVLYLLHKLEDRKYKMTERDLAGSRRMRPSKAWALSSYVRCLTNQYFSINELLWGLKSQSEGQTGKKTIDSARLKFQDVPRVKCEQRHSSEGYVYWELSLAVTVGLGEQSDEVLYNIHKRIDWYWKYTGLSKALLTAVERQKEDTSTKRINFNHC